MAAKGWSGQRMVASEEKGVGKMTGSNYQDQGQLFTDVCELPLTPVVRIPLVCFPVA